MTIGPQHLPTEWVPRIASLVAAIRSDWDEPGIRSVLAKIADRPLGDVSIAAVTAALTRPDQRTPAVIASAGSHWPDLGARTYTEPGIVTYCEHGEPGSRCDACYPNATRGLGGSGIRPTPEQRAAMRAAIAEAKTSAEGNRA